MIGVLEIDIVDKVVYSYTVEADKCQTVFVKGESCWELEDYTEGWSNCRSAFGAEKLQLLLIADKFVAGTENLLDCLKSEIKEQEVADISTAAMFELCESKLHIKPRGKIKKIQEDRIILENGNELSFVTLGGVKVGEMVKAEASSPIKAPEAEIEKISKEVGLNVRGRFPGEHSSGKNKKPQVGPLPGSQPQKEAELQASQEAMYTALQQRKKDRNK